MEFGKKEDNSDIVYVPVPRHLLAAVYRTLGAESGEMTRNLIDLIKEAGLRIGADRHPVSLHELHHAYIDTYPGVGKGTRRATLDTTINNHCINMRSRFPEPANKRKRAPWLLRPTFKRMDRASYMLLSDEEIEQFCRCRDEDNPLIYEDEYDVADLAQCGDNGGEAKSS